MYGHTFQVKYNTLDLFTTFHKSLMRVLCEASFCASTKNGLNKSVHKFKTKFKIKTTSNQKMDKVRIIV